MSGRYQKRPSQKERRAQNNNTVLRQSGPSVQTDFQQQQSHRDQDESSQSSSDSRYHQRNNQRGNDSGNRQQSHRGDSRRDRGPPSHERTSRGFQQGGDRRGGGGRQQRSQQQGPQPISDTLEQGFVSSLNNSSFGFLRCADRDGDLFFHFQQLPIHPDHFPVDQECEFRVARDNRGKLCAIDMRPLEPGTIVLEKLFDQHFVGVIDKELVFQKYQRAEPKGGKISLLSLKTVEELTVDGQLEIPKTVNNEDKKKRKPAQQQKADSTLAPVQDKLAAVNLESAKTSESWADVEDDDDMFGTPLKPLQSEKSSGPLKDSGEPNMRIGQLFGFAGRDLANVETPLDKGDVVSFQLFYSRRHKSLGATNVVLVQSGGKRQQGQVSGLKDRFGFIRCLDSDRQLFFHFSSLLDQRAGVDAKDDVEFTVRNDSQGKPCAVKVKVLPRGTVQFTEVRGNVLTGHVTAALRLEKQSRKNDRSGGGFMQKPKLTAGQLQHKVATAGADVVAATEGQTVLSDLEFTQETLSFSGQDLFHQGGQAEPILVGDKISFQLAVYRPTQKRHATNIKLVERNETVRRTGIVNHVDMHRQNGSIACAEKNSDISFHFADLPDDCEAAEGLEVEYAEWMSLQDRKQRAVRIKQLPKGSVKLEEVLPERLLGVISKEARRDRRTRDGHPGLIHFTMEIPDKTVQDMMAEQQQQSASAAAEDNQETVDDDKEQSEDTLNKSPKTKVLKYSFSLSDVDRSLSRIVLRAGDQVEFQIRKNFRSNKDQAALIQLVKFGEQANQPRTRGIVTNVQFSSGFGFIKKTDRDDIHFSLDQIVGGKKVTEGVCVEFDVDQASQGPTAVRIAILDAGSVVLDDLGEKLTGVVKSEAFQGRSNALAWGRRGQEAQQEPSELSVGSIEFVDSEQEDSTKKLTIAFDASECQGGRAIARNGDQVEFYRAKSGDKAVQVKVATKVGVVDSLSGDSNMRGQILFVNDDKDVKEALERFAFNQKDVVQPNPEDKQTSTSPSATVSSSDGDDSPKPEETGEPEILVLRPGDKVSFQVFLSNPRSQRRAARAIRLIERGQEFKPLERTARLRRKQKSAVVVASYSKGPPQSTDKGFVAEWRPRHQAMLAQLAPTS